MVEFRSYDEVKRRRHVMWEHLKETDFMVVDNHHCRTSPLRCDDGGPCEVLITLFSEKKQKYARVCLANGAVVLCLQNKDGKYLPTSKWFREAFTAIIDVYLGLQPEREERAG